MKTPWGPFYPALARCQSSFSAFRTSAWRSGPIQNRAEWINSSSTGFARSMSPARFALATTPSRPAGDCQAGRGGCPPPASFIHQQKVGSTFDCEHNCFSLARVQILAKFQNAVLVLRAGDDQPWQGRKVDCRGQVSLGSRQFLVHGGRNEHLAKEQGQEFETANAGEIQDRRSIGNDDQSRSTARVCKSSRNSCIP